MSEDEEMLVVGSDRNGLMVEVGRLNPRTIYFTHDQFNAVREWAAQRHGERLSENPRTLFDQLAAGKTLGRNSIIGLVTGPFENRTVSPLTNCLELRGPDSAAQNLQVVLLPPLAIPVGVGNGQITAAQATQVLQTQQGSGFLENDQIPNFAWSPLVAVLEWGVGGGQTFDVEIDALAGTVVNLAASYLRLRYEIDPASAINNGALLGDDGVFQVGAFVAPGYGKPGTAQKTILVQNTSAAHWSPVYALPKMAKSVRVSAYYDGDGLATPPATGYLVSVVFLRNPGSQGINGATNTDIIANGAGIIGAVTVADNGGAAADVPIPSGTQYVAVFNQSGFELNPQLIFNLSL